MTPAFPAAWLARAGRVRVAGDTAALAARLRRTLAIWRSRLGMAGLAAIGLGAAALAIEWGAIVPAQRSIAETEQRLAVLARIAAAEPASGTAPHAARTAPVGLGLETSFPDRIEQLVQHASDHGLQLNDGLYTVTREAQGGVVSYQVTLPLQGSYPQVRRFLATLLKEEAGLALLDVQFHRAKIGDPALEAVVRLSYYMRPSP
jgi:hypothetical protein